MDRNVAGQKLTFFAFTPADGLPKTGDAANITIYLSKDDGSVTALTDTSATELDATNAPGSYSVDVSQSESNGIKLHFSGKSSTSGVVIVPQTIYTRPAGFSAGTANVNTATISNNAITANAIATDAITSTKIAADALGASELAAAAATEIANAVQSTLSSGVVVDSFSITAKGELQTEVEEGVAAVGYTNALATLLGDVLGSLKFFGGLEDIFCGDTGADTTHAHLPDASGYGNDVLNDRLLVIKHSGTQYGVWIEDWVQSTALATLSAALPFTPSSSDTYFVLNLRRDEKTTLIHAKTTNLPSDPADASDIATAFGIVNSNISALNNLSSAQAQSAAAAALNAYDPPTKAELEAAHATTDALIATADAVVDAIKLKTDNLPASPAAVGSAMNLADGAITDAKFTIPTLTGPASGPVGFITQLWRRMFKKATKSSTQIKTFADDGTTVVTTQTISSSGTNQEQEAAS